MRAGEYWDGERCKIVNRSNIIDSRIFGILLSDTILTFNVYAQIEKNALQGFTGFVPKTSYSNFILYHMSLAHARVDIFPESYKCLCFFFFCFISSCTCQKQDCKSKVAPSIFLPGVGYDQKGLYSVVFGTECMQSFSKCNVAASSVTNRQTNALTATPLPHRLLSLMAEKYVGSSQLGDDSQGTINSALPEAPEDVASLLP